MKLIRVKGCLGPCFHPCNQLEEDQVPDEHLVH